MIAAGMRALAVAFPATVRRNEYWKEHHPALVARATQSTLARLWTPPADAPVAAFDEAMGPYLRDPFRGTVERRVLAPGQTALDLELEAAQRALRAADLSATDVDQILVASFRGDHIGVGNAAFLARALGTRGAAWNLESACSSSVVGYQTACALVRSGQARTVLVVTSCTYSRDADPTDSMSWFLGDGAGAFVVGAETAGRGYLGAHTLSTTETCDTFRYDLIVDDDQARVRMNADAKTGRCLRDTAEPYLLECCRGAADAAGIALDDVKLFVFNTPTAWYAKFAARALGVDGERTVDAYPRYANVGPALMPANLHLAASQDRLEPDDLVLLYSVGSVSTASAVVMRWGDVRIG